MNPSAPLAGASVAAIARAEWRLIVRRRSYAWLMVGFALLLAFAAVLGGLRQRREAAQQRDYQRLVRAQWESQPDRHPHRVAHYGTFAFKPVGPLATFDPGVDSFAGRIQYLEAHRQNGANFAEAGALSSAFRLGELSPAFVLHVLLPLLVVVLGHRAIADEAESGRARLLLSQGTSPGVLVAGKALGLVGALAPAGLLGVAALVAGALAAPAEAGPPWLRAAVAAAAAALHAAVWVALALWISARAGSAARALGTLVALWAAACIVLPRAAGAFAAARHPLPTKSEFTARLADEVHRLGDAHNPDDPVFARLRTETLARYGVARVEDLPVNYGAIVMARGEELTAETFARHFGELVALQERQESLLRRAAWLAPVLGVRALSAAASGTDLRAQTEFQRAAEVYRFDFVQRLNGLHRDHIRYANDRGQRLAADHWDDFPDFRADIPPLGRALDGTAGCWAALGVWLGVAGIGLARTGLRP